MKKTKFFAALLSAMAMTTGFTSCQNDGDEPTAPTQQEKMVTINVGVDGAIRPHAKAVSRAGDVTMFGDGSKATYLYYAIYDKDDNIVYQSEGTDTYTGISKNGTTGWTIAKNLTVGEIYKIALFAASAESLPKATANGYTGVNPAPYGIDFDKKEMVVNYQVTFSDEYAKGDLADAFIKYTTFTCQDNNSFTLTRPFAQVNIGSNEQAIKDVNGALHDKYVGVCDANAWSLPSKLNFATGAVSDFYPMPMFKTAQKISNFDGIAQKFPKYNSCQYMFMGYVLAPQTGVNDLFNDLSFLVGDYDEYTFYSDDPIIQNVIFESNMTQVLKANRRIIVIPNCVDTTNPENPDPVPGEPGFADKSVKFNILVNDSFDGEDFEIVK